MSSSQGDDRPVSDVSDLLEVFRAAEKPPSEFRLGAEAEKFGVDERTGAPVPYDGERSVMSVFAALTERFEWQPQAEVPGGPIISLKRGRASITLEPGAQLELSGEPLSTVREVATELDAHLAELREVSEPLGLAWLTLGFHPFAKLGDLPSVPKQRYRIMREYMPQRGPRALDMMWRTATVQTNVDYSSEADAIDKLTLSLRLSPILQAMTANSPFYEGRTSPLVSQRADVWLKMDPPRSGLIDRLWARADLSYADYAEWALDAGMFLFRRNGERIENTGQPFRAFMRDGFEGHRATYADWLLHLQTLFPEARLKNTIEVRCCDSLPRDLACAVPAFVAGILYDDTARADAHRRLAAFSLDKVQAARPDITRRALAAKIGEEIVADVAIDLIDIASAGLGRRSTAAAGAGDERPFLEPLAALTRDRTTPSERLLARVGDAATAESVIDAARI